MARLGDCLGRYLSAYDVQRDAAVGPWERIGRDDADLAGRKLGFTAFDSFGEGFGFFVQRVEHLIFGDGAGLFTLHVDDPATFACENRDVSPFGFTGSIDDAAHDRHLHRRSDRREFLTHFGDEFDQVDFDAATGGAGDEFGFFAIAHAQDAEQFLGVFDFVDWIGRIRDANGVADPVGQQRRKRRDAADASGFGRACMGDAEMQREVEAFADGAICIDADARVDALGADDDIAGRAGERDR